MTGDCLRPLLQSHHSGLMRPQKAGPSNANEGIFLRDMFDNSREGNIINNDVDLK